MDVMMGHGVVYSDPMSNKPQISDMLNRADQRPQSVSFGKRCGYTHAGAKNKLRRALEQS